MKKITKNLRLKGKKVNRFQEMKLSETQNFDHFYLSPQKVQKLFENISKTIPRYSDIITGMHQDFFRNFRDVLMASISFQENFFENSKIKAQESSSYSKIVSNSFENLLYLQQINNEYFLLELESHRNIFREWNKELASSSNALIKIFLTKN